MPLSTKEDTRLRNLIEQTYPGSCTAPTVDAFADEHGFDEMNVAVTLDEMEIFNCVNCGWWSHPGETELGHVEDCEGHDEMVCGDCCND